MVPLADQDRSRWNAALMSEGIALNYREPDPCTDRRLPNPGGHRRRARRSHHGGRDHWQQILALYDLLAQSYISPIVLLNRAVAVAMVHGPRTGLDLLPDLERDPHLRGKRRVLVHAAAIGSSLGARGSPSPRLAPVSIQGASMWSGSAGLEA